MGIDSLPPYVAPYHTHRHRCKKACKNNPYDASDTDNSKWRWGKQVADRQVKLSAYLSLTHCHILSSPCQVSSRDIRICARWIAVQGTMKICCFNFTVTVYWFCALHARVRLNIRFSSNKFSRNSISIRYDATKNQRSRCERHLPDKMVVCFRKIIVLLNRFFTVLSHIKFTIYIESLKILAKFKL